MREDIDSYTKRILYQHSSRLAEKSGITMPRVSQNQQNRSNRQFFSVEDYFKKTIAIPFLDHIISDISLRFTTHKQPHFKCYFSQALLQLHIFMMKFKRQLHSILMIYPFLLL